MTSQLTIEIETVTMVTTTISNILHTNIQIIIETTNVTPIGATTSKRQNIEKTKKTKKPLLPKSSMIAYQAERVWELCFFVFFGFPNIQSPKHRKKPKKQKKQKKTSFPNSLCLA